jgi:hypothetical protein
MDLVPSLAIVLAWVILGLGLTALVLVGFALSAFAVYLVNRPKKTGTRVS